MLRSTALTVLCALALAIPAPTAAATAADPHVTDRSGDANGLNGQWYNQASLSQLLRLLYDFLFQGDPFGEGRETPVSHAPADLREARFETEYEAVPVGEDGIDHRATALLLRIRTEQPPAPLESDGYLQLQAMFTIVGSDASECLALLRTNVHADGSTSNVSWYHFDCEGDGTYGRTGSGWTATRGQSDRELVVRVPFDALEGFEGEYFREGVLLSSLQLTSEERGLFTYDVTRRGDPFTIGEDMPGDVGCTRGCPAA